MEASKEGQALGVAGREVRGLNTLIVVAALLAIHVAVPFRDGVENGVDRITGYFSNFQIQAVGFAIITFGARKFCIGDDIAYRLG